VALNAALLAAEALPRGGVVALSGSAGAGLVVLPDGISAAWPPPLLALLSGTSVRDALSDGPRHVVAPLLLALLADLGWRARLGPGPVGGPGPLLLGPG
jgi:histidine phosphotransferase ChpT